MAHAVDPHNTNFVGDFVDYAVVADSDAPVVLTSREFAAAGWTRVGCERLNRDDYAVVNLGR